MSTDATITTPSGWTLTNSWISAGANAYLFKCVRGASNPSLAFIATASTFRYWTLTAWRGPFNLPTDDWTAWVNSSEVPGIRDTIKAALLAGQTNV
jgi:hypothetical protein